MKKTAAVIAASAMLAAPALANADTVIYMGGMCACWNPSSDAGQVAGGYLPTRGTTQALPYWAGLDAPLAIPTASLRAWGEYKKARAETGQPVVISGVSMGALTIHDLELRIMSMPEDQRPTKDELSFVVIADEAGRNGIVTKIPILALFTPVQDIDTPYDTVSIVQQYDGFGDWPDNQTNILAVANAAMGIVYLHSDYHDTDINKPGTQVYESVNSLGGKTTHYVVPTDHLPLFRPVRDIEKAVTGQNIVADTLDGLAKPIIDSAYKRTDPTPPSGARVKAPTVSEVKAKVAEVAKPKATPTADKPVKRLVSKIRESLGVKGAKHTARDERRGAAPKAHPFGRARADRAPGVPASPDRAVRR